MTAPLPRKFLKLDDEGYFISNQVRWTDARICKPILESLRLHKNGSLLVTIPAQADAPSADVIIESFDQPLVARHVEKRGPEWFALFPYDVEHAFEIEKLKVDEWDRFHGYTLHEIPFVMSREAQNDFFNLVDEFEDDGFLLDGKFYETQPWLKSSEAMAPPFWQSMYAKEDQPLPWELQEVHPAIVQTFKQMKFNKSRIAVMGSGGGHDAAWLAWQGHLITAFDFAPEAIALAQERYKNVEGLKFERADVLNLPASWNARFDIVIEHTLFCAVSPSSRASLVKTWRRLLIPGGHLVAIHFVMDSAHGPPFGATEWEIRQRLQDGFAFLYWSRWQGAEPASRLGTELVVVAQKKSNS